MAMIAEHTSVYDLSNGTVSCLSTRVAQRPGVMRTLVDRLINACKRLARAPVLPYAALWEASVMVDLLGEPERPRRAR